MDAQIIVVPVVSINAKSNNSSTKGLSHLLHRKLLTQPFTMQKQTQEGKEKKKASKEAKKARQKEESKNSFFGSNIQLGRIGLRRFQREQIHAKSSFFRSVAKFFNVQCKS